MHQRGVEPAVPLEGAQAAADLAAPGAPLRRGRSAIERNQARAREKPMAAAMNRLRKIGSRPSVAARARGVSAAAPLPAWPPSTNAPKPATATAPPKERKKLITPVALP